MPFNGTGTFVRVYNWTQDAANNIPITASRVDTEDTGFATGLSTCITKDGQTVVTANLPMNSHKFTGLSVGNARTDSITLGQVQDNQFLDLGTLGGAADAYTGSPSPAITAYASTMRFTATINATNATTTPYLQLSGIATPASNAVVKKTDASGNEIALEIGDMVAGAIGDFKRNAANTAWIMLNPRNLSSGSFSNLAAKNFSTPVQTAITISGGVITVVGSNNLIDGEASAADTLDTVNGLVDGQQVTFQIVSSARPITFSRAGNILIQSGEDLIVSSTTTKVTGIYRGSDSKLIIQGTSRPLIYDSGEQTIADNTTLTLPHLFPKKPDIIRTFVRCKTAEYGYSVGDEMEYVEKHSTSGSDSLGFALASDATNIYVYYGAVANLPALDKATRIGINLTNANWKLIVRSFLLT